LPDQVTIDEDIKLKKSLLSKADTTIPRIWSCGTLRCVSSKYCRSCQRNCASW
jgi:hypothetical protein